MSPEEPPTPAHFADRTVAKPLVIIDGDCGFCRRTAERMREITGDRADYAPSQEVGGDFPSILPEEFAREFKLVEPDGHITGGAEAACRLLFVGGKNPWSGFPLWAYRKIPGARRVVDVGYRFVAEHRMVFSALVRWGWGNDLRRPTFDAARTWFLRVLGLVYFAAFLSMRVQVDGLVGSGGVLPFARLLEAVRGRYGVVDRLLELPSLAWLVGGSDGALHGFCNGGMILALGLIAGVAPVCCLVLLWACYLSVCTAGQVFMGYQWDALLLEAGFLSIFLAPPRWWAGPRATLPPVSRVGMFLMRWLLFRLMLMSGVVKLTSGDATWSGLTALRYHYETQPLPTWVGWWMHQAPDWWQTGSVGFVFFAELAAPFFVWGPRRVRLAGFWVLVTLQGLIALTGNYGFFNALTAALCLLLLDDRQWPRWLVPRNIPLTREARGWRWLRAPVAAVYVVFGAMLLWQTIFPVRSASGWLQTAYYQDIYPFRSLNTYGLFASMTTERPEIILEGSRDGEHWQPYAFRWKMSDPQRAPAFVSPHLPRLDWQMWFAALDRDDALPWFEPFLVRLLQGSPEVLGLLAENPFPNAPPRYVRAVLYDYRFTDLAERRRTGAWWRRTEHGLYFPAVSLDDVRNAR